MRRAKRLASSSVQKISRDHLYRRRDRGEQSRAPRRGGVYKKNHPGAEQLRIVISSVEHESILETARALEQRCGVEVIKLPVNKEGVIDIVALKELERPYGRRVDHAREYEVGTVQPLREIKFMIDAFRKTAAHPEYPLFHTDAAQSFPICIATSSCSALI